MPGSDEILSSDNNTHPKYCLRSLEIREWEEISGYGDNVKF